MAGENEQSVDDLKVDEAELSKALEDIEYTGRNMGPKLAMVVAVVAVAWALFQIWIASPMPSALILADVQKRAIHLGFALLLGYLVFPATRSAGEKGIAWYDIVLALIASGCALYLFVNYSGLVSRRGVLWEPGGFPVELIIGGVGIVLLLEATRRSIGLPLVIVALVFLLYSLLGQQVGYTVSFIGLALCLAGFFMFQKKHMVLAGVLVVLGLLLVLYGIFGVFVQDLLAHKGVSLNRLVGYQWLGQEAIFGIPIDVSVDFVFLFVLFGAMLDKAGAGQYFLDLAFAMVGRYRGGPAKAAVLASGMTGLISGSSIANVATTGVFTIPVMIRTGLPAVKAGAIEVAASTNGQIMPPIMGAAAFIMAELIGIQYTEVVIAATIPAVISYMALLYISHLEALKLGLKGLPKSEVPLFFKTLMSGLHFIIPIIVLVYLLMAEQWTASSSVFYAIAWLILTMIGMRFWPEDWDKNKLFIPFSVPVLIATALRWAVGLDAINATVWGLLATVALVAGLFVVRQMHNKDGLAEIKLSLKDIVEGFVAGSRNMINLGIAVASAGIIVGAVGSTGLNNALVGIVEVISGGNVYILLFMTAVLCLVLGMGLPTTANYLVVASLLAGVLVELGQAAGLVLPLIAVHMFVFYYGLMADSTPPVCLAAFAAAAISRADPLQTGVQSFMYDIRTAILPFVFIFNTELLLIGVDSWWHGIMIFVVSLTAILAFSSATQGWLVVKTRWYEVIALLVVTLALFRPGFFMDLVYPPYQDVDPAKVIAGELKVPKDTTVRFHVTRETNYGDRLRLNLLKAPEDGVSLKDGYGLELEQIDGRYVVKDVAFNSQAEKFKMASGDVLTKVDYEKSGLPDKKWVYPLGLLLLGLIIAGQLARRRKDPKPEREEATQGT